MKLDSGSRELMTNASNQQNYNIQANAKMFEILSSKIYTYKIAAIVREIACNAHDSHIESGKGDVPFRVVLPNEMHPYFEIEDFGMGLSQDEVYTIYTNYGASTKSNSNDVIGALGLGSKTPFAYTTSFTIQTRKDGIQNIFNAFIGQGGEPSISLLQSRETSECNGVKIKVPVKSEDFQEFYNECAFILSFFDTRPNVIHDGSFEFDFDHSLIHEIREGGIVVRDNSNIKSKLYSRTSIFAVMGTVCYPVRVGDVLSEDESLNTYLRQILLGGNNNSIFLDFPIGSLDIAASREALSIESGKYTEKELIERFSKEVNECRKEDQQMINDTSHPVIAMKKICDRYNGYGIIKLLANCFEYKGVDLRFYMDRYFLRDQIYRIYKRKPYKAGVVEIKTLTGHRLVEKRIHIVFSKNKKPTGMIKYSRDLVRRNPNGDIVVCLNKTTHSKLAKCIKYLGTTNIVIHDHDAIRARMKEQARKEKLANGGSSSGSYNRLPKRQDHEVTARYAAIRSTSQRTDVYPQTRVDVSDPDTLFYYVDSVDQDSRTDLYGLYDYMDIYRIKKAKRIEKDIIVLSRNKKNEKAIAQNNIPHLEELINESSLTDDEIKRYSRFYYLKQIVDYRDCSIEHHSVKGMMAMELPFVPQELYDLVEEVKENKDEIYDICESAIFYTFPYNKVLEDYINEVGIKTLINEKQNMIRDLDRQFDDTYPLVRTMDVNFMDDKEYQHIKMYIDMVDQMNYDAETNTSKVA